MKVFIKTNLLIIPIVSVINVVIKYLFNSPAVNYMYLMSAPKADNPFVIEAWPWHIGVMEVVAFIHMIVIYSFFLGAYKFKNKINIKEKMV